MSTPTCPRWRARFSTCASRRRPLQIVQGRLQATMLLCAAAFSPKRAARIPPRAGFGVQGSVFNHRYHPLHRILRSRGRSPCRRPGIGDTPAGSGLFPWLIQADCPPPHRGPRTWGSRLSPCCYTERRSACLILSLLVVFTMRLLAGVCQTISHQI
jgi:hypothetical protein